MQIYLLKWLNRMKKTDVQTTNGDAKTNEENTTEQTN